MTTGDNTAATVPDEAITAAAEALREAWPADFSARLLARAVLSAAYPAIREALAQEIEAMPLKSWEYTRESIRTDAARIVRGKP